MKTLIVGLFGLLSSLLIIACVNPPDFPDAPVIEYLGVNKSEVYQGSMNLPADTLNIFFSFTDGDGDLSVEDETDIFVYDTRFPTAPPVQYKIPAIPSDGTGNGIRGEITLNITSRIENICCITESGVPCSTTPSAPIDTFSYEIEIRDRAGNFSNRIRTETLSILCQL